MAIRATRAGIYAQTQRFLNRNTTRMQDLEVQASTLKRINSPSDDPAGAAKAMALHADRHVYNRYMDNISEAQGRIDLTTSVMQSVSGEITEARGLIVSANNPDVSASARESIGNEVNFILDNILNEANTMREGKYIFAGTDVSTQPFETTTRPGGEVTSVSYHGNRGTKWATVGRDTRIPVNENGQDVFMAKGPGKDLFTTIARARDIINDPDMSTQQRGEALSDQLADIDAAQNDLLESMGKLAGRAKTLELRNDLYTESEIGVTRTLAQVEDADITDVVYKLQKERAQFELILATSAGTLKPTLMDFLR